MCPVPQLHIVLFVFDLTERAEQKGKCIAYVTYDNEFILFGPSPIGAPKIFFRGVNFASISHHILN